MGLGDCNALRMSKGSAESGSRCYGEKRSGLRMTGGGGSGRCSIVKSMIVLVSLWLGS